MCGARVSYDPIDFVMEAGLPSTARRVWHFGCLPVDDVMAAAVSIAPESSLLYFAHHLGRLRSENAALRRRTDTLLEAVGSLMIRTGITPQNVADIGVEFRFYDPDEWKPET